MRKHRIIIAAFLLVMMSALGFAGLVNAHSFRTGNNVNIEQNQIINETVFAAGQTLNIGGEIYGDVFCAGQTINISATVHGDIICAGQTITVNGTVNGDVRLAGQSVSVGSMVAGNATIAGQTFNLESSGKIGGDVTVGSNDANFSGIVGRDIAAGGENVVIGNEVGRDIKGTFNNLSLTSKANVKGNIDFTSNKDESMASGAVVAGKITRSEPIKKETSNRGAVFGFTAGWFIYWFIAMLVGALVLILLFPHMFKVVTDNAIPRPWKSLLIGFLASILVPVCLVILAITFVGIPLAILLGLLWLAVGLLSGPVFAYYLGRITMRNSNHSLFIMLFGASVLIILYFLPVLGFLAFLAASWVGSGMILQEVFRRTPKPHYELSEPAKTLKK